MLDHQLKNQLKAASKETEPYSMQQLERYKGSRSLGAQGCHFRAVRKSPKTRVLVRRFFAMYSGKSVGKEVVLSLIVKTTVNQ